MTNNNNERNLKISAAVARLTRAVAQRTEWITDVSVLTADTGTSVEMVSVCVCVCVCDV